MKRLALVTAVALFGCGDTGDGTDGWNTETDSTSLSGTGSDGVDTSMGPTSSSETGMEGDGDGDATDSTGDGDGDSTGSGDGGDGDGDGDGDGSTGDGDGDGSSGEMNTNSERQPVKKKRCRHKSDRVLVNDFCMMEWCSACGAMRFSSVGCVGRWQSPKKRDQK